MFILVSMANPAKITIRVTANRGSSNVSISTAGKYNRLITGAIAIHDPGEPLLPSGTAKEFWASVLSIAQVQIAALP